MASWQRIKIIFEAYHLDKDAGLDTHKIMGNIVFKGRRI